MRLSAILSVYMARHFLISFLSLFALFVFLIFMLDCVELLRRASSKPHIGVSHVFEMAALKLPHMGQKVLPFAVMFGGMIAFWRLNRHHELVVTRGAGVSAWQFLLPVLIAAFALGALQVGFLNPAASKTLSRYERLESMHFKGAENLLAISKAGLWLRQANGADQSVIHAANILQDGPLIELRNVIVFIYKGADTFVERIDSDSAVLEDGFWRMNGVTVRRPEEPAVKEPSLWLETDLTAAKIQDSFAPPETLSFWDLPRFIRTLEDSGFSATRHRLHWHALLASPVLMCAMVMIAATFTLRTSQRGGAAWVIAGGAMTGFVLYFFSDIIFAMGLSDNIPAVLAAWTPAGVTMMLGLATLLHMEDG